MIIQIRQARISVLVLLMMMILAGVHVSAITAHARMQPSQGQVPLSVYFVDNSDGTPIDWRWDFGDGYTGEGQQVMHTYFEPGLFTIRMKVTDESGTTDTLEIPKAITVINNPFFTNLPKIPAVIPSFQADFRVSKKAGTAPLQVSFFDLSTGDPSGWKWDFGDGTHDDIQNPVHIYQNPGFFTIKLTTDKESSMSSKELKNYISVSAGGTATAYQNKNISTKAVDSSPLSALNVTPSLTSLQSSKQSDIVSGSLGVSNQTHELVPGPTGTKTPISADHGFDVSNPVQTPLLPSLPTSAEFSSSERFMAINDAFIDFYNKTYSLIEPTTTSEMTEMLHVSTIPVFVSAGDTFSIKIVGKPDENVYFWIMIPENVKITDNPAIPVISPGQTNITRDDVSGPYLIGKFIPSDARQNLSIREMIPHDSKNMGTSYYGMARLNQTGMTTIAWNTLGSVPGMYFIRVESGDTEDKTGISVRKAAASVEIK